MQSSIKSLMQGRLSRILLAVSLTVIFNIGLRLVPLKDLERDPGTNLYKRNPIMSTYDGYYYLRLTKDYLEDSYLVNRHSTAAWRPDSPPLMVTITAWLHKISGVPIEWIAFVLPVILSSFLLIVLLSWSLEYGNLGVYYMSAVAASANAAWYSRSSLGRFDTDSLLPFFILVIPFLTYKFINASGKIKKGKFGLLLVIVSILFYYWWVPARYFLSFIIGIPYVLSMFFVESSGLERLLKLALACAAAFTGACLLFVFLGGDPSGLGSFGKHLFYASSFIKTAICGESGLFPSVAQGISELTSRSLLESAGNVSWHWMIFLLSLSGLVLALIKKKEALLFLLIPFILAAMGFMAKRFLIFTAPVAAFGLGFLAFYVCTYLTSFSNVRASVLYYGLVAAAAVVITYSYLDCRLSPVFSPQEMAVAETLKRYPADGPIWCWWDYGYLVEYLADKPAFSDGGSQQPERIFLSAVPFASRNARLSANWIRFFSLRGASAFVDLSRDIGSKKTSVAFLKEVFSSPDRMTEIIEKYSLPASRNWKDFLFPRGRVYVFIPYGMMDLTKWWYYFGTFSFEKEEKHKPYYRIIDGVVRLDLKKGIMKIGGKSIVLKEIDAFRPVSPPHLETLGRYEKNLTDFYLIFGTKIKKAFLLNEVLKETVCIKLLFDPVSTDFFKLLSHEPFQAGVYDVEYAFKEE